MQSVSVLWSGSRLRNVVLAPLAVAGFMGASAGVGHANVYDFFQDACASGLGCSGSSSALIATATTSQDGSNIRVTIHIVNSSFFFIQAGQPPMTGINTSPAATGLPTAPTQHSGWSLANPIGGVNISSHNFAETIGFSPQSNTIWNSDIVFDLSGVTLADFVPDADGFVFAVDFCKASGGVSGSTCLVNNNPDTKGGTGFDFAVAAPVPGPIVGAGLPGLIAACGGLLALARRRQRKTA